MSKQLYEVGDSIDGLEVVAVTYSENEEGERVNFSYTIKSPEDIERPETETE